MGVGGRDQQFATVLAKHVYEGKATSCLPGLWGENVSVPEICLFDRELGAIEVRILAAESENKPIVSFERVEQHETS